MPTVAQKTDGFKKDLANRVQVSKAANLSGSYVSKLETKQAFRKGDVVGNYQGTATPTKTKRYTSVQVGPNSHIELNCDLVYINHSCDPNVKFDVIEQQVIALKDIPAGTELTFFYPSTEWEMQQPFDCQCKSAKCFGKIQGAKFLTREQLKGFYVNDHIRELLSEQES